MTATPLAAARRPAGPSRQERAVDDPDRPVLTAEAVGWLLEAIACRVRVCGALDPTLANVQVVGHG